jgi:hypothetical protein
MHGCVCMYASLVQSHPTSLQRSPNSGAFLGGQRLFWDVTAITWLSTTYTYRLPIVSLLCNCRSEMYQYSQNSYRNLCARLCTDASKSPRALCMSTVFVVDPCQSRDRPVPARVAGSE